MRRFILIGGPVVLSIAAWSTGQTGDSVLSVDTAAPVVIETMPEAGSVGVDPDTSEVRVRFNKPMQDGSWSWCTITPNTFPETTGSPRYLDDGQTCVLPVKLEPGRSYGIWINTAERFLNFQDRSGRPAVPYLLVFETASAQAPNTEPGAAAAATSSQQPNASVEPAPLDMSAAEREAAEDYAAARPKVREYVRWTAGTFGKRGMWINEDAFAHLSDEQREQKVVYLAAILEEGEYGRHLGRALAEASALQDERLVPGLMKVAGYHRDDADYDCRPKWMAVAALARQESDAAVPMLIGLVDHGNQNTRTWAQAALSRKTDQDFRQDKQAWADWWQEQGHEPVDAEYLEAWVMPAQN